MAEATSVVPRPAVLDVPVDVGSLVDARFGPARDVRCFRLTGSEPDWWVQMCTLGRSIGAWSGDQKAGAAGTSIDLREAAARANGELLERYSALNALIEGTSGPLGAVAASLPRCAPDEPCPPMFRGVGPETELTRVRVQRLDDGVDEWLPAGYVHLHHWPQSPEPLVTLPISTGLAFHSSVAAAIWSGICEVAERDAMMMAWWPRHGGREIALDGSVPTAVRERLDRLAQVDLIPRLYDITTDFRVPTVFCVLHGPRYPYATIGAACRTDPGDACAKALDEAVSIRVAVRGDRDRPVPSRTDFDWVEHLEDHSRLYAHPGMDHALDFLGSGASPAPYAEFADSEYWAAPATMDELRTFAVDAVDRGWTVLWTEITSPDVAHLGHTVKVVIPEMVPLSQTHRARWLATPRLVAAAGGELSAATANPFPHPFA